MKTPEFLTNKKRIIQFICAVAVFSTLFILIYKPIGVTRFFSFPDSRLSLMSYTAVVVAIGFVILIASRFLLYRVLRRRHVDLDYLILWLIAEIFFLSLALACFSYFVNTEHNIKFLDLLVRISASVVGILAIPYVISVMGFMLKEKERELQYYTMKKNSNAGNPVAGITNFHDKSGKFAISIKNEDLLYLESADNYVKIHYLNNNEVCQYLLRNTLKNVEEEYASAGLVRCHRFYLVNMHKVKIVRKLKGILVLEFTDLAKSVPVSKTYISSIIDILAQSEQHSEEKSD